MLVLSLDMLSSIKQLMIICLSTRSYSHNHIKVKKRLVWLEALGLH